MGVMKNISCTMLWLIGTRSRNRVLTMPKSSDTHTPLTISSARAGTAVSDRQVSGCGKIASITT